MGLEFQLCRTEGFWRPVAKQCAFGCTLANCWEGDFYVMIFATIKRKGSKEGEGRREGERKGRKKGKGREERSIDTCYKMNEP